MRIYTFTVWCEFIVKVQNLEAIIFSTVFDNVILQIGFPVKKWQGGIEECVEKNTSTLLLLLSVV